MTNGYPSGPDSGQQKTFFKRSGIRNGQQMVFQITNEISVEDFSIWDNTERRFIRDVV